MLALYYQHRHIRLSGLRRINEAFPASSMSGIAA
jgi:hypothetical protein